ncbi:TetR/AcrR family transcriptional regulator [Blastomonas sp. SL216]|uniref:TetR/AcrR family transcriptional regulator n=1 Tax=Blastomonas sp. SL216 TaxID=2995169 RepID=UPI00237744D6|nr:TetR/AcrR family transcriptional regulator [Blastomonas sp. SL216]
MPDVDLIPRKQPQQTRSRETMQRVLEEAELLLVEQGVDGFNTNVLAERAGVGVRAIYRYFPNKWAILVELIDRSNARERDWVGNLRLLKAGDDWRCAIDRMIDGFYRGASDSPSYSVLRAACQVSPQLREVDDRNVALFESDVAEALAALGLAVDPHRLGIIAQIVIEISGRLIDLALKADHPASAELLIGELKRMLHDLLAPHLPG